MWGSLDGMRIVEVGGGYGGQGKVICDMFDIASYTIVDLSEALDLTARYLAAAACKSRFNFVPAKMSHTPRPCDLFISNYALSECSLTVQQTYIDCYVRQSSRGYVTYNETSAAYGVDSASALTFVSLSGKDCTIADEYPRTFSENSIVTWGDGYGGMTKS